MKIPTLLLTSSAIAFDRTVKLIDTRSRIDHTLESVGQWLDIAPAIKMVICDGSGHDFSTAVNTAYPHADVECLAFENDRERVASLGKGYGEGEIIRHAIDHAELIRHCDFLAKCTGKLWVTNFWDCLREWNGRFLCAAHFADVFSVKPTRLAYIDTRFYLTDKAFYRAHFENAHLFLGGPGGFGIEDSFRRIVVEKDLQGILFRHPPEIHGVGGGSGTYYKNNRRRRIKNLLRQKLVQSDPHFKSLFREP